MGALVSTAMYAFMQRDQHQAFNLNEVCNLIIPSSVCCLLQIVGRCFLYLLEISCLMHLGVLVVNCTHCPPTMADSSRRSI